MDMFDLQTQRGIAICAENYHTTDTRVYKLIEPTHKSWTVRRFISELRASTPGNREYLRPFVSSQIVTSVEQ